MLFVEYMNDCDLSLASSFKANQSAVIFDEAEATTTMDCEMLNLNIFSLFLPVHFSGIQIWHCLRACLCRLCVLNCFA